MLLLLKKQRAESLEGVDHGCLSVCLLACLLVFIHLPIANHVGYVIEQQPVTTNPMHQARFPFFFLIVSSFSPMDSFHLIEQEEEFTRRVKRVQFVTPLSAGKTFVLDNVHRKHKEKDKKGSEHSLVIL